jgi:hypothetical protein
MILRRAQCEQVLPLPLALISIVSEGGSINVAPGRT